MTRGLSARQRELLRLIEEWRAARGSMPTLRELGAALGGVTPTAVHLQLAALAQKGYLRWPRGRPRQVELLRAAGEPEPLARAVPADLWSVPIIGTIAAGAPIDAFEAPEGTVLLDPAKLRSGRRGDPSRFFALRVEGDSMVDACIQDGDVVIVRRQHTAAEGETVVALLEGQQATLKRFYRAAGGVRLEPANRLYPDIYVKEVAIQGVVVGVVRYC